MSIKCINWAWDIPLHPTLKLVLMSLADYADDSQQCFPSKKHVATRCCISVKTAKRALKSLEERELIRIEPQYRKNGSNSSNLYTLNFGNQEEDKFTPSAPEPSKASPKCKSSLTKNKLSCHPAESRVTRRGDIHVLPLTTNKPSVEPPKKTTTTLVWPKQLSESEKNSILKISKNVDSVVVQLLIDELAGKSGSLESPVGYFHALLSRYHSGGFVPAKALKTRSSRRMREHNKMALEAADKRGLERLNRLVKAKEDETNG